MERNFLSISSSKKIYKKQNISIEELAIEKNKNKKLKTELNKITTIIEANLHPIFVVPR